jgi:hypothetical protein
VDVGAAGLIAEMRSPAAFLFRRTGSDMVEQRRRCSAITSGGKQCAIAPPAGRDFCLHHDPERTQEAAEARRRGGVSKSRTRRARKLATYGVRTMADLEEELMLAICEVRYGEDPKVPDSPRLDPVIARTMASMIGVLRHVAIATEYERQINELREMIAKLMSERDADHLQTA